MKNLLKLGSLFLFAVVLSISVISCDKDEDVCYECAAYTDADGFEWEAVNICEGDEILLSGGQTYSKAQVEILIDTYELAGYTCEKK